MKHAGRPWILSLVALPLVGCGGTPIDDVDPSEPGACGVTMVDAEATVAEGARTRLAITVEGAVEGLTALTSYGDAAVLDDAIVMKTPYGSGGATAAVTLTYSCHGEVQQISTQHSVRPITWSALPTWTPGSDGPLSREYGTMWIDEANPDRLLVWGGFHYQPEQFTPAAEFWQYDLVSTTWTQLSPTGAPTRPGGGLALLGDQQAIYFGGLIDNSTPFSVEKIDYSSNAPVFTTVAGGGGAIGGVGQVGDYQPSLAYDAPRDRLITACGLNMMWGHHCRVRSIDPATGEVTELATVGDGPVGRNGHFWVHDAETERLIVFSGDGGQSEDGWMCDCQQDTWALELAEEPMRWVRLDAGSTPPGRRNGAFVLDTDGHRMLVWGGTPDGQSTAEGLYALDLDRGEETWTLVTPIGEAPIVRSSGHGVYDAARQRMIVGFGNGEAGVHTDLWALSL